MIVITGSNFNFKGISTKFTGKDLKNELQFKKNLRRLILRLSSHSIKDIVVKFLRNNNCCNLKIKLIEFLI